MTYQEWLWMMSGDGFDERLAETTRQK